MFLINNNIKEVINLVVLECSECDEEFEAKTEKKAFEKLKKHRKEVHLPEDGENMSYIT